MPSASVIQFTQFYASCMHVMFSDVPWDQALILAESAWPRYTSESGAFTYDDMKHALNDMYHQYYCNAVAAADKVELADFLQVQVQFKWPCMLPCSVVRAWARHPPTLQSYRNARLHSMQ